MKNLIPNQIKDKQIITALVVGLLLIWTGFGLSIYQIKQSQLALNLEIAEQDENKEDTQAKTEELRRKFFDPLRIEAKAYVVYDINSREIVANREATSVLPLASITKVMTSFVMTEELGPKAEVVIKSTSLDNKAGLYIGERWQLANLSALTLVVSSNDGAQALADAGTSTSESILAMNNKAKSLGLTSMYFTNPTGLDEDGSIGGRGTAEEVAKLFAHIIKIKPEVLRPTKEEYLTKSSLETNHSVSNTNKIIKQIPGILASKTGYTDIAGGNLAIIVNIGLARPVAIVVLGSSQEGRFTDTEKLTQATFDYYAELNKK